MEVHVTKKESSPTALAGEALASGVLPQAAGERPHEIPGDGATLRAGDPDVSELDNAYVGDTGPGGHMGAPDQNNVDDIGRAMGVAEGDGGALRTSSELLDGRDRKRQELQPPARPAHAYDPEA
jgi:hypothetical protein